MIVFGGVTINRIESIVHTVGGCVVHIDVCAVPGDSSGGDSTTAVTAAAAAAAVTATATAAAGGGGGGGGGGVCVCVCVPV